MIDFGKNRLGWVGVLFIFSVFSGSAREARAVGRQAASGEDQQQVGTLTSIEGNVTLFTHASKLPPGPSPRVRFEGLFYTALTAEPGMKVSNGSILRTAVGSKARVVYPNGDQLNLGSGTAYRVSWKTTSPRAVVLFELQHGKLRGVVEKGGPRSQILIRTRSATMGVRGTDFYLSEEGASGKTEVTVMRGEVEFAPLNAPGAPVRVASGFSATIPEKGQTGAPPVAISRSTREALLQVQRSTEVKKSEVGLQVANLVELEKKAIATTLADIQKTDPNLHARLKTLDVADAQALNAGAVAELAKSAPAAPITLKPSLQDLEDPSRSAYEKYFNETPRP